MIDDGVKGQGLDEEEVKVADIAIHMMEALERGDELAKRAALSPTFAYVESEVSLSGATSPGPEATVEPTELDDEA